MELTTKDKALIRCRLDSNIKYACHNCEIHKECEWGANYNFLAEELLIKLNIKWEERTND